MPIILNGTTGITTPGITNTGPFTFQGVVELPAGAVGAPSLTTTGDTNTGIYFPAADTIAFAEGGVEALRINSSAQIAVNTAGTAGAPVITKADDLNTGIFFPAADTIAFAEGGVESMRIDSSGNLGLGVTPSAWSIFRAIQIGPNGGSINAATGANDELIQITSNAFYDGTNYKRVVTAHSMRYVMNDGQHIWETAASGAAGSNITFSTAMTLDASGNLGLGVAPTFKMQIAGTAGTTALGLTGTHAAGDTGLSIAPSAITGGYNPIYSYPSASTGTNYTFGNSNSSSSSANSRVDIIVGGGSSGDPKITYTVAGVINWSLGVDNSDSDAFKISTSDSPGTNDRFLIATSGVIGSYAISGTGAQFSLFSNGQTTVPVTLAQGFATATDNIGYLYNRANADFVFGTNNTERARITNGGNFCIGNASAAGRLQLGTSTSSDNNSLVFNRGVKPSISGTQAAILCEWNGIGGSEPMTFMADAGYKFLDDTGNTEWARITSGGALLVGTTAFTQSGNRAFGAHWSYTGSGGEGGCEFRNTSTSSASDPNPCLILQKGSTTTSSDQRFIQFYANTTSQPMGGIVGNGATNVQFVSLSDARQKTNIQSISGSLEKILALNPVSFDWIKNGEHVKAGFVAQNVEQVFPEFVVENFDTENGEPRKGLTGGMTGGIIAHLVKAIQELKAELDALKGLH